MCIYCLLDLFYVNRTTVIYLVLPLYHCHAVLSCYIRSGTGYRNLSTIVLAHYWHDRWCVAAECILCLTKANQCTWEWVLINSAWKQLDSVCGSTLACSLLSYSDKKPQFCVNTAKHSFNSNHVFFAVDQVKFGPPLRKVTEPYPDMVMHFFL